MSASKCAGSFSSVWANGRKNNINGVNLKRVRGEGKKICGGRILNFPQMGFHSGWIVIVQGRTVAH